MINKGFVSSVVENGEKAIVIPQDASSTTTFPLVIPYFLKECLKVNMPVVYVVFPDNTGIILARLDGEWNHKIYKDLTVEGTTHITEKLTADSGITATGGGNVTVAGNINLQGNLTANGDITAGGVSLQKHTHSGIQTGNSTTNPPN